MELIGNRRQRICRLLCAGWLCLAIPSRGGAQFDVPDLMAEGNLSLPLSPELTNALELADQATAAADWERAIEILQLLIEAEEDACVSPIDARSVQTLAAARLAGLPAAARQLYERQFGPAAEALLEQALQAGDVHKLEELIRRYFCTASGRQAAWKLAVLRQDQGSRLSAALLFDQLTNDPAARATWGNELSIRAAAAWLALGAEAEALARFEVLAGPDSTSVEVFGQAYPRPTKDGAALDWLREIVGRSAIVAAPSHAEAAPLPPPLPPFLPPSRAAEWNAPSLCKDEVLASYPDRAAHLIQALQQLERDQRQRIAATGRILIPAARPLCVGPRLLVRGPDRLSAYAVGNGTLLWTATPVDFTYRELAEKTEFPLREQMVRELYLGQRAWRDETSAALSSDGELAYTIMDGGMIGAVDPGTALTSGRRGKGAFRDNTLHAYSLLSGKQRWSIGGPVGPADSHFGGLFFLGPPLPHEGLLYCLVEDRGQVRLLALDPSPADGPKLLWSQGLLHPPPLFSIEHHEGRRTAALTPIAAGHVLICPTGAGSVAGIDLLARRLLWITSYDLANHDLAPQPWRGRPPRLQRSPVEQQQIALDRLLDAARWRQGEPVPAGRCVLIATVDTDALVCLDAATGKQLWQRPRDEWLYLAGTTSEHVVLIGETSAGAFRLTDGEPAWATETPLSSPCGRGVAHAGRYTLPLATNELVTLNLETGAIVARSPSPESGLYGNLIVADGRLISQSATEVRGYAPLHNPESWLAEVEAAKPPEAPALASAGELWLHAGAEERGVALLRAAVAAADAMRPRLVLAGQLTEQLRRDFVSHRAAADEVEQLVQGTPAEVEFRRLMAEECQEHSDPRSALRHLLRLSALLEEEQSPEPLDAEWSVALDRWAAAHARELLTAEGADHAALYADARTELSRLLAGTSPIDDIALRRLARLTRGTPLAAETALALARRSGNAPLAEQVPLWLALPDTSESAIRAEAAARLAALCLDGGHSALAAPFIQQLATEFTDQVALEGLTGSALLAAWDADPQRRQTLADARRAWPAGEIAASSGPRDSRLPEFQVIPTLGRAVGPLAGWTFTFDPQSQKLAAQTLLGLFAWETPASGEGGGERSLPLGVMVRGGLVQILWPDRLQVLSAITPEGGRFRPILYTRSLLTPSEDMNPIFMQRGRVERSGVAGPLTADVLCYQQGGQLIGVDPATGQDVWRRFVSGGISEIFGDDEFVIVRPQGAGQLHVLRALDGAIVATREYPADALNPPSSHAWGRFRATLASVDDDHDRLAMYDPATGREAWEMTLASPVQWTTLDGDRLLVVDGRHECRLLETATGKEVLRTLLPLEAADDASFDSLTAVADAQRVYVVLNRAAATEGMQVERERTVDQVVNGRLCCIERETAQVTWKADLAGLHLDPQLPSEWPVLVLTARQKPADAEEFEAVQQVLDKATGKVLLNERSPTSGAPRDFRKQASWRVMPPHPTIRLSTDSRTLSIRPAAAAGPPP